MTAVEEPTNCPNVSKIASTYALVFQEFLQDSSLPIWNRFNNTGFWRQLTVSLVPLCPVIFNLLDLFLLIEYEFLYENYFLFSTGSRRSKITEGR